MPGAPAAGSPPRSGKSRLSESRDGRDSQTREYLPPLLAIAHVPMHFRVAPKMAAMLESMF